MNYLQPSEYELYGLETTTALSWVTAASAIVDAHCRRVTLAVNQYTERLRTNSGETPAGAADVSAAESSGAGNLTDCVGARSVCDSAAGRVGVRGDGVGRGSRVRNSGNVGGSKRAGSGRLSGNWRSHASGECAGMDVHRNRDCLYGRA